jgi:hypothetical protein
VLGAEGVTFRNCAGSGIKGGGAVNIQPGTARISNSRFLNNTTPQFGGGLFCISGTCVLTQVMRR